MQCKTDIDKEGRKRISWRCRLCGYDLKFHTKDMKYIPFFAVHHLMEKHCLSKYDVWAYDPWTFRRL